jgi:uncharacterized protein DUF5666
MKWTSNLLSHMAIGMFVARATGRVQAVHSRMVQRMEYQRFLPLTVIAGVMSGCGGGMSPTSVEPISPPAQNTSVTILVSSTANDRVVQANLTVTKLMLTDAMGNAVNVLSTPQSAEFMHLNGLTESLATVDVPQGAYTAATATLGNANFACVALTSSGGISAGTTTQISGTPTVTVPAPISISGTHLNLVLNLQISSSQGDSACSALYTSPPPGSSDATITPAFTLMMSSDHPGEAGLIGVVSAFASDGSGFNVAGADGPVWSVKANGSTVFQGIAGLSALSVGQPVNFDASPQSDGSLLATRVEVTDANVSELTVWRGPMIFISNTEQQTLFATERLGALFDGVEGEGGPWALGFGGDTIFRTSAQFSNLSSLPFSATFGSNNMVAGQSVYLSTHASAFPNSPGLVAVTTVTLLPQTINGTVTAVGTAGSFTTYTVALANYNLFTALATQGGQTTILTNPGSVVVYVDASTQTLNTATLAIGSLLRFNGLVFNDNGTLRMDCAEVLDGVAL